MTIISRRVPDARTLSGLNRSKPARKTGRITTLAIIRAEEAKEASAFSPEQSIAVRRTLERAGMDFVLESDSVRPRSPDA